LLRNLAKALREEGYAVDTAEAGDDGLYKAENYNYDAMVLDVMLPGMDGFDLAIRIQKDPGLAQTSILMLTSDKQQGDVGRSRELGIAAYLVKPVRQAELRDAIVRTLQPVLAWNNAPESAEASETSRSLRILLAEDNRVNQRLAVGLLERDGHSVTVVGNGEAAVAAVKATTFDAVLMDVQMPVMNGLDATGAIRAHEKTTGGHIPIIAMTAHAMQGDRERCLAAGMDGYISKPISLNAIRTGLSAATSPVSLAS